MRTKGPMYFLVKDIKNYEQFYSIREGDIVLDGGANEGYLSIYYAKKVKSKGRVFAFEPDKMNVKVMKQNLKMNPSVDNIKIYEDLIWKENTNIEFYEAGTVASSVFYEPKKSKKVLKKAITIDSFCKNERLKKLDFIKMDIEGAEIEALIGATETLKRLKPNFVIASYHSVNGEITYKKLEIFFQKNNYPYKTVFYKDGEILTFAGKCVE
ncbi:MAG: FkbM family methyltransferase [Flavobacteriaceae bacterium]|nr:FkbM family methyltransferase [Flavobacteriaceae bacterium]